MAFEYFDQPRSLEGLLNCRRAKPHHEASIRPITELWPHGALALFLMARPLVYQPIQNRCNIFLHGSLAAAWRSIVA
jgi:hypothetical protein